MADFFDDSNPAAYVDLGSVTIWFTSKQCSGQPGATFPDGYLGISQVSQLSTGFVDGFRDTCLAYFDPLDPSYPTNQGTLDSLTSQFEQDYTNWKRLTIDMTFSGVCNFIQSGLIDTYEITYGSSREPCTTRIYTYPFNYRFHELGHFDSAHDCPNLTDSGDPNFDGSPLTYVYGPPVMCVNGILQLTRYGLVIEDGRLVRSFISTDLVS